MSAKFRLIGSLSIVFSVSYVDLVFSPWGGVPELGFFLGVREATSSPKFIEVLYFNFVGPSLQLFVS